MFDFTFARPGVIFNSTNPAPPDTNFLPRSHLPVPKNIAFLQISTTCRNGIG